MLEVKGLGTRLLEMVVAFIEEGEIARKIIFGVNGVLLFFEENRESEEL